MDPSGHGGVDERRSENNVCLFFKFCFVAPCWQPVAVSSCTTYSLAEHGCSFNAAVVAIAKIDFVGGGQCYIMKSNGFCGEPRLLSLLVLDKTQLCGINCVWVESQFKEFLFCMSVISDLITFGEASVSVVSEMTLLSP